MENLLTKKALAAFCESKPADERYGAGLRDACAICQFLRANGYPTAHVDNAYWQSGGWGSERFDLDAEFNDLAYRQRPHTFGALAARLRGAQS